MWSEVSCLEETTRRQLELSIETLTIRSDVQRPGLTTTPTNPNLCFRVMGKFKYRRALVPVR